MVVFLWMTTDTKAPREVKQQLWKQKKIPFKNKGQNHKKMRLCSFDGEFHKFKKGYNR